MKKRRTEERRRQGGREGGREEGRKEGRKGGREEERRKVLKVNQRYRSTLSMWFWSTAVTTIYT